MSALTDHRDTPEINGRQSGLSPLTILAGAVLYNGAMLAADANGEVQPAADTIGLRVLGRVFEAVDNTADGLEAEPADHGVFRYANSATYPLTAAQKGQPCYVADDQTVAGWSTNLVAAGLVHDVDDDGVWVDQRGAALALARRTAAAKRVVVTDDTAVSAAQAHQGNVALVMGAAGAAKAFTLPAAAAGARVGVVRGSVTAGDDVSVVAGAGDTVLGSEAGKQVTNAVDAVSQVLWLLAVNATAWVADAPPAGDQESWVVDNS